MAAPTLIFGANAPDLDAATIFLGSNFSLGFRRGWDAWRARNGGAADRVDRTDPAARPHRRARARPGGPRPSRPGTRAGLSRGADAPGARLAEHVRRSLPDAVRRHLVLRRRAVHHRPLGMAPRGHRCSARTHTLAIQHRLVARVGGRCHVAGHRVPWHADDVATVVVRGGRGDRRPSPLGRVATTAAARRDHLPGQHQRLRRHNGWPLDPRGAARACLAGRTRRPSGGGHGQSRPGQPVPTRHRGGRR